MDFDIDTLIDPSRTCGGAILVALELTGDSHPTAKKVVSKDIHGPLPSYPPSSPHSSLDHTNPITGSAASQEHHGEGALSMSYDLDELTALLLTLKIKTIGRFIQRKDKPSSGHYLGGGKLEEVALYAREHGVELIVVDGELSGLQMRNMEKITCCQVIDRSAVILEIFSRHASTKRARLQVQMARWKYMMPRMRGAWTHLSRQSGGGGVMLRGMGEKQIEIDRRIARQKISKLQKRLDRTNVETMEQGKSRRGVFKVAIVGYTNSGKTTLMKGLTTSTIDPRNQLFATLSAKVGSMNPAKHSQILFTDTVGFIRRLPHSLIESFRSTLEETLNAHLALHVVDVSHAQFLAQMKTTHEVLAEIGAAQVPRILIFNKTDKIDDPLMKKTLLKRFPGSLWISAHNSDDAPIVMDHVWEFFHRYFCRALIRIYTRPYSRQGTLGALIHRLSMVKNVDYFDDGTAEFEIMAQPHILKKLEHEIGDDGEVSIAPTTRDEALVAFT